MALAPSANPPIPPRYRAFAAAYAAELQSLGAPGGSVAILEHGEVTFAHGFGTKGPNSTAPVDARTLFRAGSMGKALTATTFLQLVDEGKASVDQKLVDIVPSVALTGPFAQELSMRQLLDQSSGLFDFTNFSLNPAVDTVICPTDNGALHAFVGGKLFAENEYFMSPPGALWAYDNTNYVLVGAAIKNLTGLPYTDAMQRRLFAPLGMDRTFYLPSQVLADGDYSDGLSTNADGSPWDVTPDAYDCGWFRPAGFEFTSAVDYAKFVQFLYAGNTAVLSDASWRAMQAPQVDTFTFGRDSNYGYGLPDPRRRRRRAGVLRGQDRHPRRRHPRLHRRVLPRAGDRLRDRDVDERGRCCPSSRWAWRSRASAGSPSSRTRRRAPIRSRPTTPTTRAPTSIRPASSARS